FGSLESSDKDLIPDAVFSKAGIEYKVSRATEIDAKKKLCRTEDGEEISYDKLVLATGSKPRVPSWLPGTDLENVFTIPKNKEILDRTLAKLQGCKKIVTIGGGFIGVEVSDELNKLGKDVTIVEVLPHVLGLAFDPEIAEQAGELLVKRGVKLRTGVGAAKILGNGSVTGVELINGEKIEADAVILSMGYDPNTDLARKAGLSLNSNGCIRVDEYMRTETPGIFAVGDCAEKRDFVTRKLTRVMLASTASSEARVAGTNLYQLSVVKTFSGTISIFATAIGDTGFGVAGLTEAAAKKEGFNITIGTFSGVDRHPGTLPGTHSQYVKLIVGKTSGVILGGEVVAGTSTGELTNFIGLAIQAKIPISALFAAQIGTHPLLTAPPTAYPVIKAAESIMRGCGR
ncbi:MAG TPA: pyridine nucleotide-disulfide oxidoreductase, partial [Candidatus Acetothermia bacterium]|nr:pyridine nucleotide-disulfide oxidoreductase [Candidatus Acetothermia bacterium]HEX32382.1 pyridine nucleotide-disulfide oxidoreductase [Candidatus Acetothermia bacterium]